MMQAPWSGPAQGGRVPGLQVRIGNILVWFGLVVVWEPRHLAMNQVAPSATLGRESMSQADVDSPFGHGGRRPRPSHDGTHRISNLCRACERRTVGRSRAAVTTEDNN
ncbi:hypothetical protein VFPFJ_00939 [Purpureocillium lilacinum]|uniref:Uncharacterized protein n=1 Tax=Purpureocillium lilacinum TaxID=33203 RepID=A0A179HZR8_PURLI|nr:hypothetical protein VFPFJ_00939 [Purpureocillium lilacinum]OAQ94830.1 hypothetical protein VFPFJ_00939 [Purpureocillium lilacinum]